MMGVKLFLSLMLFAIAYSLVVGSLGVAIILLTKAVFFKNVSRDESPPVGLIVFAIMLGIPAYACQGIIAAKIISLSLSLHPGSWSCVWWLIGGAFSIPWGLTKRQGDDPIGTIAFFVSEIAYAACLVWPSLAFGYIETIAKWFAI
jgi:hypothetical protein